MAFAGTGKTTSLVQMTKDNPNLKFLVVVYNKSVQEYGEKIFPKSNTQCVTAHSIAYNAVGYKYKHKSCGNLKAKDLIDYIYSKDAAPPLAKIKKYNHPSYQQRAGKVLATLSSYMNSPDPDIDMEHVPSTWDTFEEVQNFFGTKMTKKVTKTLGLQERIYIFEDATKIWKMIKDVSEWKMKMPHDGYMKLYQLENPNLQDAKAKGRKLTHDVLMIDEGQDMNPAMLEIFRHQNITKIIVGDPSQQIYMFRGAVNALGSLDANYTYHLTQSFRFGPNIAYAANTCLETLQNVKTQTLVGGKNRDFLINRSNLDQLQDDYKPVAIVARTNLELFKEVVETVCEAKNGDKIKSCFNGGLENYSMQQILDFYYLSVGENDKIETEWIKKFNSLGAIENMANNSRDVEQMSKIEIVKKYRNRIPELINTIRIR